MLKDKNEGELNHTLPASYIHRYCHDCAYIHLSTLALCFTGRRGLKIAAAFTMYRANNRRKSSLSCHSAPHFTWISFVTLHCASVLRPSTAYFERRKAISIQGYQVDETFVDQFPRLPSMCESHIAYCPSMKTPPLYTCLFS